MQLGETPIMQWGETPIMQWPDNENEGIVPGQEKNPPIFLTPEIKTIYVKVGPLSKSCTYNFIIFPTNTTSYRINLNTILIVVNCMYDLEQMWGKIDYFVVATAENRWFSIWTFFYIQGFNSGCQI